MGFSDFCHDVMNVGQDVWVGATGWLTGQKDSEQEQADQRAQDATKQGDATRARLAAQDKGLVQGGFDPPSIKQHDNWQSMSHQEIYNRNQQMSNATASQAAGAWTDLAKQMRDIGGRYATELKQKIANGWEGQAAQAAGAVGDPLSKWMTDSAGAFEMTGNQISTAGSAAEQVKAMVPQPEGVNIARQVGAAIATGPTFGIGNAIDAVSQHNQAQDAQKAAQETMGRVLSPTYQQADSQVPAFQDVHGNPTNPPPPAPQNSQALPPPVNPGGMRGGGGVGGSASAGAGAGVHSGGSAGMPGGGAGLPGGGSTGPAGSSSAWAPSAGTLPGGAPAPGAGQPGGGPSGGAGGMMGGMPGGMGGGAGKAGGVGAGAGSKGSVGAGGRAGSGSSSGSGSGAGGRAGATGASGSRGASGGGGMGAGGKGGGHGSEDQDHERPGWLEEMDDVWLNDMPKVAPPVFGE
jgi:hypothetical protein